MVVPGRTKHVEVHVEFMRRVSQIPAQGLGLSVDLYQPDLMELMDAMAAQRLTVGYLEVFKAAEKALEQARSRFPSTRLTYHGEGLWATQPDFDRGPSVEEDLASVARHLRTLASPWINLECATKQMAGYSFGTYLPPLYTRESADVTAENVRAIQRYLDRALGQEGLSGPLLLLEMPPLTYFGVGTLSISTFFAQIADQTPCGLVLDIGHLWTVHRYTGAWRQQSLEQYTAEFLDAFPMERVVEIHLAGLTEWETSAEQSESQHAVPPRWIDAHAVAIPEVLFDVMEQVLASPRLTNLKGIALEVDTKRIPQIVREFARLCSQFGQDCQRWEQVSNEPNESATRRYADDSVRKVGEEVKSALGRDYDRYAKLVTGQLDPRTSGLLHPTWSYEDLHLYQSVYLPHEILHWGGELQDMFPESCRLVEGQGISLADFVSYWFREPQSITASYDFFLLKIERFVHFVAERAPAFLPLVEREAGELRASYMMANEGSCSVTEANV